MSSTPHPTSTDDASRDETDEKTPVNTVRLSSSLRQLIIDECVICGDRHAHGSKDPTVANGGRSHRGAHCRGVDHSGGYYIELDDDADPPERWYSWVDGESGIEVSAP